MTFITHALYQGPHRQYRDQAASVRPHHGTAHLPLNERMVLVRWDNPSLIRHDSNLGQAVGSWWHLMPKKDFVSIGLIYDDVVMHDLAKIGEAVLRFAKLKLNQGDA